jgi:hypothetical protein
MLAEADTIQKAKELKDLAITAADWAKRKGLGEEAIRYARSYALEAERKMGELLRETERAKGAIAGGEKGSPRGHYTELRDSAPTLAALGLTKRESAQAQMLAKLPAPVFEQVKSGQKSLSHIKKEVERQQRQSDLAGAQHEVSEAAKIRIGTVCDIRQATCADLLSSGIRPDAVITDPPYEREFLPVFSELAAACVAVPVVAVMSGQTYLPEVVSRLSEHLQYRWTLAYLTPGGQSVQIWPVKVNTFWKPVLLFGQSAAWLGDVARSETNDNDKRFHDWGQSESGMADLIQRLTKPGDLVCDPFLGGGTTAVVALSLGRRFVGCDINPACVKASLQRVEVALCKSEKNEQSGETSA